MPLLRPRSMLGIALLGAAALPLAACGGEEPQADREGPTVIATNSIVEDMVSQVVGARADVSTLVGADGDVHDFEPTPRDVAAIADADLVVQNGLELEPWMDDVLESAGGNAALVSLSDGIRTLPAEGEHGDHGRRTTARRHAEGEEEHAHGDEDPHVWQSVPNAEAMVENARDALIEVDPEGAETYRANAAGYLDELAALQREVTTALDAIPTERRILVTNHDTFGYFALEYDFGVLGDALASVTTVGGDPSAADVAAFVAEIDESGVPAIFPENTIDPALIETLAREAGVAVAPPLYTDALGPQGSDGDTYVGMMRANATTIADALGDGS